MVTANVALANMTVLRGHDMLARWESGCTACQVRVLSSARPDGDGRPQGWRQLVMPLSLSRLSLAAISHDGQALAV